MKKKFSQFSHNLPFRMKVALLCFIISLIPMLVIGPVSYSKIRSQLIEQESSSLEDTLRRETEAIEEKMDFYLNALDIIVWNDGIKNGLSRTYLENYDLFLFYKNTLDPTVQTIRTLSPEIRSATLYTTADINPHGNIVLPLSEAEGCIWYEEAMDSTRPVFRVSQDRKTLYLACRMYYRYEAPVTLVCLSIGIDGMFSNAPALYRDNFGFLVADSRSDIVYETFAGGEDPSFTPLSLDALQVRSGITGNSFKKRSLYDGTWTAYLYRYHNDFLLSVHQFTLIAAAVFLLGILMSAIASQLLSSLIVHPLEELVSNMTRVEDGEYRVNISDDNRKDEIGVLIRTFRDMVEKLNHLINEVLVAKINQQKYELRILQSQINPHFLYNTLSLINNRAIMTDQKDISKMAQLLSTFYRTTLNKGKSITTVQTELENVKAYIAIQQMMHSDSFNTVYDIDDSILNCPILNFIVQPLAENAIVHGLDQRSAPGKGTLTLTCHEDQGDIIISVLDNGAGMSQDVCDSILTQETSGYGIRNVHQRIQLYYGKDCGLSYRSTPGFGTCASIRINMNLDT
jgi:two-component system sensor histidine kinase YesM